MMSRFFIELKKTKRTGVIPIMLLVSLVGAFYTYAFIALQKETLLSLDLTFSQMLLTQASSFVMVINLFQIVLVKSIIYNMDYRGNAVKKMYMLPVKIHGIYLSKLAICVIALFICILIEYIALFMIGRFVFPLEILDISEFIIFAFYTFISSLPSLTFMLLIASRNENIWTVIGIGVVGFLSGMTMAMGKGILFLLNPFVLILKPSISSVIEPQMLNLVISITESIIFTLGGVFLAEKIFYE